ASDPSLGSGPWNGSRTFVTSGVIRRRIGGSVEQTQGAEMTEYIKLRGTAAKVLVAIALGVVLTVAVENGQGGPAKVTVRPAAATHELLAAPPKAAPTLKLNGLSPELKQNFKKISGALQRLLEEVGIFYYFQHEGSKHKFETINDANARFLSVSAADSK